MIHTGSNRMISLEPLTKNRDLDATKKVVKEIPERQPNLQTIMIY